MSHPLSTPDLPLSRIVEIANLPADGLEVTVATKPDERTAVAKLNNLAGLAALDAQLRLKAMPGGSVAVTGRMKANVTQICVVSLDAFDTDISEPIDLVFAPPAVVARAVRKRVVEEEDEIDVPDEIVDGTIDVGALTAEALTLALDPYPRKPGVAFAPISEADEKPSPFAALAALAKDNTRKQ